MARSKRYHVPGSFYHVMLRGNNGQDIFFSDMDRCAFCLLLQQGVEKFGHRIHAFCLMKNHIHLLVQVGDTSLSKIIQNVAFRYSQRVNRKYVRKGHLFQNRFKAIVIDERSYFVRLLRYIHMNPVRAKIVKSPEQYIWSGHNSYIGKRDITWLTIEYGLSKFDSLKEIAIPRYSSYVLKQESQEELNELKRRFKDGQVLGDDDFLEKIHSDLEDKKQKDIPLEIILKAACLSCNISEEQVLSTCRSRNISFVRGALSIVAKETRKISVEELARLFKTNGSSVSRLVLRFTESKLNLPKTQELLKVIREKAQQIAERHV